MSYDENRISDQIDGGLLNQKRECIKKYVSDWMKGYEPDTFVKNKYGNYIYSSGGSSINLQVFFEDLAEFIIENEHINNLKK